MSFRCWIIRTKTSGIWGRCRHRTTFRPPYARLPGRIRGPVGRRPQGRIGLGRSFRLLQPDLFGAFRYAYRARSVDMEFGLDYYRDDVAGRDAANYFIPYAHLRFDLGGGGFVPYVELDGT